MTVRKALASLLAFLAVSMLAVPAFAARGSADFTHFITFGDSFAMGVSNASIVETHQQYAWPAVVARQVGLNTRCTTDGPGCFQMPLISEPGIGPEMVLTGISPVSFATKPGLGSPINLGLARPYNNLAIDGSEVQDILHVDGDGNEKIVAPIVLRGLGEPVQQGLSLHPTFIGIWIGGDDGFNGVQAGNPAAMTSVEQFTKDYNDVLDALTAGAPNAGFVVANLPTSIDVAPFVTLIPYVIVNPATGQPVLDPSTGKPIPYIADLGGGNYGQLPAGSYVTLYAKPYLETGYGIPAALAPFFPPLPNIGKPLPDSVTLTPTETAAINERFAQFNSAIQAAAGARNIPVVDMASFFARTKTGIPLGGGTGIVFTNAFITGGISSYDGFHMTDIGNILAGNEFIKKINEAYETDIPLHSADPFFAFNGVTFAADTFLPFDESMMYGLPNFSREALEGMGAHFPESN